jgi:hypothetical protein
MAVPRLEEGMPTRDRVLDNADNAGVSHLNNARVLQVAFILLSVACSVSVAGSDIGPNVLAIIIGH